jgi:hypothetical protein
VSVGMVTWCGGGVQSSVAVGKHAADVFEAGQDNVLMQDYAQHQGWQSNSRLPAAGSGGHPLATGVGTVVLPSLQVLAARWSAPPCMLHVRLYNSVQ